MIPGSVALLLLAAATAAPAAPPQVSSGAPAVLPYRAVMADGSFVDWYEGIAGGIGRVRIFRDIDRNRGAYLVTKGEAETAGRTLTLKALGGLPIDGSSHVGDRADVMDRARRALDRLDPVRSGRVRGSFFEAVMELRLRGQDGVLAMLLPATNRLAPPGDLQQATSSSPDAPPEQADATGLVIDARLLPEGARPEPSLVPRVLDASGRIIHDAGIVDLDFAREYGLVTYAIAAPPDSTPPEGMSSPRIGARPIVVDAVPPAGPGSADIVVSAADGERILAAAAGGFLRECRVMVLLPPPRQEHETVVPRRYMRPQGAPPAGNPNEPGKQE